MFKGQDSRVHLEAVLSGAEMAVDGPDALPLLLCCRSMVAKRLSRDLEVCPAYIFGTFRTDDAGDKTGTFTGEGISEVEGLMCSAGMDDIVGK